MAEPWSAAAGGIAVRRADDVRLRRLRGRDAAALARAASGLGVELPDAPNRARGTGIRSVWMGPGDYLVIGGERDGAIDGVHIADVTDAHVRFAATGTRAADLLAKGCPLDLHPRVFGPDHCAQTILAQVPALIEAVPDGFAVTADISLSHYLEAWFSDAMIEFGLA